MITKNLITINEGTEDSFEVFLNDKDQMFFGSTSETYPTCFTLTFSEWQEVKKYVDKSFKDGGVNG